jgi:hypothetical protein
MPLTHIRLKPHCAAHFLQLRSEIREEMDKLMRLEMNLKGSLIEQRKSLKEQILQTLDDCLGGHIRI